MTSFELSPILLLLPFNSSNLALLRLALMAVALLGNLTPLLRGEAEAAVNSGRYYARTWQTDDGLPRNTVTAITQTPDGYLWLGTPQGVIRFDGVKFTPMEDDIFAGFIRARTRVLYVDRFQRLWIGTGTTGVIRYDG
ncbi:MAG: two-component regulator propeller domain-containing protein, partial [Verrucomicrobiota bacterium]